MKKKPSLRLGAKFELEADGKPAFIEAHGLKHFKIKLFVEDAPKGVASVTYELHPTYYNPVREVFGGKGDAQFEERITSYGDFDVIATVSGSREAGIPVRTNLSEALEEWTSRQKPASPEAASALDAALATIRNN